MSKIMTVVIMVWTVLVGALTFGLLIIMAYKGIGSELGIKLAQACMGLVSLGLIAMGGYLIFAGRKRDQG